MVGFVLVMDLIMMFQEELEKVQLQKYGNTKI
jgi:hypothetical protein